MASILSPPQCLYNVFIWYMFTVYFLNVPEYINQALTQLPDCIYSVFYVTVMNTIHSHSFITWQMFSKYMGTFF